MSEKPEKPKQEAQVKRYPPERRNLPPMPEGAFETGVTNQKMAAILGQMATYWPQVEDAMIDFFRDLLGLLRDEDFPARQIFKSIINAQTRIKILSTLLKRTKGNQDKSANYDWVIKEFSNLNDARNSYLHGLWHTFEDGRAFLAEYSIDEDFFLQQREVTHEEIAKVLERMMYLRALTRLRHFDRP